VDCQELSDLTKQGERMYKVLITARMSKKANADSLRQPEAVSVSITSQVVSFDTIKQAEKAIQKIKDEEGDGPLEDYMKPDVEYDFVRLYDEVTAK